MYTLWSSGSNSHGQLSIGSLDDSHEFRPCSFFGCLPNAMPSNTHQVLDITSGANHTLVLLRTCNKSGICSTELWGSGDGSAGQLGPTYAQLIQCGASSTIFRLIDLPVQRHGLADYQVKLVAASWETTYVVLCCEGKGDVMMTMGSNDFGDLGIGKESKGKEKAAPLNVIDFGHLYVDGMSLGDADIIVRSVAAGQHHVVALTQVTWSNNKTITCVIGWGTSRHGQLGNELDRDGRPLSFLSSPTIISLNNSIDPVLSIALGNQHSVLLHASGKLSFLGSNRKGQLQGLEQVQCASQLGCTWNGTYVVVKDDQDIHRILATGSDSYGQLGRQLEPNTLPSLAPVEFPILTSTFGINAIACGTEHVLVLVTQASESALSSEVWGWGWNEHGNLGIGTTNNVFIPIKLWAKASTKEGGEHCTAVGIWTGSGTSWIATH